VSSLDVNYTQRSDATPQAERSALADAYRFLIETEKKGGPATAPEDAERSSSDGATRQYT
jgi:hypothetical protein